MHIYTGKGGVKWTTLGPDGRSLPRLRVTCDGKEVGVYQTNASQNGSKSWVYKIAVHTAINGPGLRIRHPTFPYVVGRFYKQVAFDEASCKWSFMDSRFMDSNLNLNLTLEEVEK